MPAIHVLLHCFDLLTLGEFSVFQSLNQVSQLFFPLVHELANVAKVLSILQRQHTSHSLPLEEQHYSNYRKRFRSPDCRNSTVHTFLLDYI